MFICLGENVIIININAGYKSVHVFFGIKLYTTICIVHIMPFVVNVTPNISLFLYRMHCNIFIVEFTTNK